MKSIRKRNPLMFDLGLFLAFTIASFAAFALTEAAGAEGAIASIAILAAICLGLVFSR